MWSQGLCVQADVYMGTAGEVIHYDVVQGGLLTRCDIHLATSISIFQRAGNLLILKKKTNYTWF